MGDEVADYLCKQLLKESIDNPNAKGRCIANVNTTFQHLSDNDKELLGNLVSNARGMDEAIDSLEQQIERTKTLTQCKLIDEDEISSKLLLLKTKKDDLDETILDLIIDGIGND